MSAGKVDQRYLETGRCEHGVRGTDFCAACTGKVDVLAVMDKRRDELCNKRDAALERNDAAMVCFWRGELSELAEARAAVAELIAKADTAATTLSNLIAARQVDERYSGVVTDLTAALARIGGDQ